MVEDLLSSRRRILACGAVVALACPMTAAAQDASAPAAMSTEEALAALPDPDRYQLLVVNEGLTPEAVQEISQLLIQTLGETHFFAAVFAHVPADSQQMAIRVRAGLHSLDAAERLAREDCEAERSEGASPCYLLAQVVPEDWDPETAPQMSHDAMYGFAQNASAMEGPKFVARSRDSRAWAMWSGEGSRQDALDECNEKVRAAGLEPDCDLVVDDSQG